MMRPPGPAECLASACPGPIPRLAAALFDLGFHQELVDLRCQVSQAFLAALCHAG